MKSFFSNTLRWLPALALALVGLAPMAQAQTTVSAITRLNLSPTATAQVRYQVTFANSVSGLTTSNFTLTPTGSVSGTSVSSVSGSGNAYTVVVNTGTGDGTLRLDVANSMGVAPTVSNTPYTSGPAYTLTRSFPAAPQLTIAGTSGMGGDVTAFVDQVQVFSGGAVLANGLQNSSFETHNPLFNINYSYNPTGAAWTFISQAGIAENGSAFNPTTPIPDGIAVAFVQSNNGGVGQLQQNLSVPTGTGYQVRFQTSQRQCCSSFDQGLNVLLNGVFLGNIQPNGTGYTTFTSATFAIVGPSLTASISSPASNPTSTSPIPVTVTFSNNVTGFVAGDVSVGNGTLSGFTPVSGTTYTFNVTPTGNGTVTVDVPANVAQDASSTGNNAASQYSVTYAAATPGTTWTGNNSTDWYTANNWTAGVPTVTTDATIPGTAPLMPLIPAGSAFVRNLTLNSGASLAQNAGTLRVDGNLTNNGTFQPTGGTVVLGSAVQTNGPNILGNARVRFWNLTVQANGVLLGTSAGASARRLVLLNGAVVTQGNPFVLESDGAATAMVVNNAGGFFFGAVTMQRYIDPSLNAGLGYRHYSSPVLGAAVADLGTAGFAPVVNGNYNTQGNPVTPFPNVFGYDEARLGSTPAANVFERGWFSPTATTDNLATGRGYTVNLPGSAKVALTGALNNGTVAVGALSRNSATNGGYHLLGNPYPAPLNWNVARTGLPAGVEDAIYVFKSATQYMGTYQFYQNGVGTLPGGLVPAMQGFFLRVSQPVPAFNFLNTWRSTTYATPTFNRGAADLRPTVQLDLVNAAGTHEPTFVYFEAGATAGFDVHYDAEKLPNTTGLNLSSEIAGGQRLAVNGLPVLGTAPLAVPLTVGVPAAGAYTLTAAQLLNLPTTPVYLRDLQTGALVNLTTQPSYAFTVAAGALLTGRFELLFAPQGALAVAPVALAAQVGLYPNPATKVTYVELPVGLPHTAATATLVDALGRPVRTFALTGPTTALPLAEVAPGVYALRVATAQGTVMKRLVVD